MPCATGNLQRNWSRWAPTCSSPEEGSWSAALKKAAGTVPVVFTAAIDPVRLGFVESLSRPGGNTTGFINIEYSFCGKWLEKLKRIAPAVTRVAVLRDPTVFSGDAQLTELRPRPHCQNTALT